MLKELLVSGYLVLASQYMPPQMSMPELSGLEQTLAKTYDGGYTKVTMNYHHDKEGHLKYISAIREGKKRPYCIFDGNSNGAFIDNGKPYGIPEDGWMDNYIVAKPGEIDALTFMPKQDVI